MVTGLPRTRNVAREKCEPAREKCELKGAHLRLRSMRIKLADEHLLPDLLAFLRNEGCVAYYEGGGIETVRPRSFGEQEATELRLLINRWRNEHPEAQIELSD